MKNNKHPKRALVPTSGAQAFAELHDEIIAVREDQLMQISVDIAYAHGIALAAADRIDELMPELQKLHALDIQRVRRLRMYAAAAQHAHLLATAPEEVDPRLPRLLDEAVKLRDVLLATAKLLVVVGDVSEDRIASIHTGSSYVEMASAVEQLGLLFEEIWDRVESRIPVTAEMVERAPGLALELNALLGAKNVRPIAKNEAQLMRQRAFTLLVKVYEECRSAVEYLRRGEGDAALYTPSLFLKKKRRASPEVDPVETEESSTIPIPIRTPVMELAPTG